jgi:hypothetical protein
MPYITKERRRVLEKGCKKLIDTLDETGCNSGDLNFIFSLLARCYLEKHGKHYSTMNEVVGVFECAKTEFARIVISKYEDEKIKLNGGLYD